MLRRVLPLAVLVAAAPFAALGAQDKGNTSAPASGTRLNWVLEGGFEFGGEDLVELQFQDGSTQTLTGGQGGTIAFGAQVRPAAVPRLALGATVGYKFVTNASENANIGITRIPVEVVGRWSLNGDAWVGAGITMHSAVTVNGDGFFPDSDLDASVAPTLEFGWRWIALTYTKMEYTAPNDETFDATAIGVSFRWVIGKK
jgi:hypothetical protein